MTFNMNPLQSISIGEPYLPPADRITMGSQVALYEWSWLVELGFVADSSGTTFGQYPYTVDKRCTGTIIGTSWILTAAYCCDGMEKVHLDFGVLERSTLGRFLFPDYALMSFHNEIFIYDTIFYMIPYFIVMQCLDSQIMIWAGFLKIL